ncbi:GNAT family N-acetyltransferase [Rheinheimera sp.]|uniref:GNAT family N-acetyltransferase n=1 Tax=Rheinheimera sp. TaxID=1869214 RepID=UPI002FDD53C1
MIKNILISIKNFFLADFEYYKIFSASASVKDGSLFQNSDFSFSSVVDESLIKNNRHTEIKNNHASINHESRCYGVFKNDELVASCYVWSGGFYNRVRGFLPLAPNEAELTFLVVVKELRGAGIAAKLIDFARAEEGKLGTSKIYARVWHSNISSERSFIKAGWIKDFSAISFRLRPLAKKFVFKC